MNKYVLVLDHTSSSGQPEMAPKKRREQRQQKKQIQQSTDSDSDDESPLSSSRRRITPSISRSSINRTENDKRSTSKKSSRWTKIFLLLDVFAIVLVYLFTHAHYHHLYHHHGGHMQAEIASYAHPEVRCCCSCCCYRLATSVSFMCPCMRETGVRLNSEKYAYSFSNIAWLFLI